MASPTAFTQSSRADWWIRLKCARPHDDMQNRAGWDSSALQVDDNGDHNSSSKADNQMMTWPQPAMTGRKR